MFFFKNIKKNKLKKHHKRIKIRTKNSDKQIKYKETKKELKI